MKRIAFWIKNARTVSLPQSLLPGVLAVGMSLSHATFSWWLSLAALFGVACAHLGMNLLDDYYDYGQGSGEKRVKLAAGGIRARIAKYPYLTSGQASVRGLVAATGSFLTLSAAAGLVVVCFRGIVPLYIALVGAVLGNSYSGRPFRLGYHGYGELLIGLLFGPLLMMGVQYAACGHLDGGTVVAGIAVGFLVANILYTHSVLDASADARMEKITLAGLLKGPKALLTASAVFQFVPFALVAFGVWRGLLPPASLCVLIVLPQAIYLWRSLYRFVYGKPEAILLKKWLGPMGDFPAYRAAGIDWFMYRWLMARNLVSFFTLILLIVYIALKISVCL